MAPWLAQKPSQLPGDSANALDEHELLPIDSHAPVEAQKPQPSWAEHDVQLVKLEHGSPTTANMGSTW